LTYATSDNANMKYVQKQANIYEKHPMVCVKDKHD